MKHYLSGFKTGDFVIVNNPVLIVHDLRDYIGVPVKIIEPERVLGASTSERCFYVDIPLGFYSTGYLLVGTYEAKKCTSKKERKRLEYIRQSEIKHKVKLTTI